MIDVLLSPIDAVSWRWLLQTMLLSLGLTLGSLFAFRGDSLSRRSLGIAAIWLLVVVPLMLLLWQPRYQIGLVNPPLMPALAGVPVLLLGAWLLTALGSCALLLLRVLQSSRRVASHTLFVDAASEATCEGLCERLDLVPPRIVVGERCCASSIGAPTLVVPADFARWPVAARDSVIAHELVHLSRRDDRFMVALQFLARCYLFCPWLQSLYNRFVIAIEEACDERAAELTGSRSLYLEGLAEAALRDGGSDYERGTAAALIDASHKHSFMQRLARLIGAQRFFEVQSGALVAGLSIGLVALAALTTFEFVPVPERHRVATLTLARSVEARVPAITGPTIETRLYSAERQLPEERFAPTVIYPGRALIDEIEGDVLVEYSITADGSTARSRVVRSTHPGYLNRAAVRAVEQTVYYTNHNPGNSGVTTAQSLTRAGGLLAVSGERSKRTQKLFLFRLNAAN